MSGERRRNKRSIEPKTVYCTLPDATESLPAICLNESPSGMSLFAHQPMEAGSPVNVWSHVHDSRDGVVLWCQEAGKSMYRVGLWLNGH
jgi:hypothetical protein